MITIRGTSTIVTLRPALPQIESQQFDNDNQAMALFWKEIEVGDTGVAWTGEPSANACASSRRRSPGLDWRSRTRASTPTTPTTRWHGTTRWAPSPRRREASSSVAASSAATRTTPLHRQGRTARCSISKHPPSNAGPGSAFVYRVTEDGDSPYTLEAAWTQLAGTAHGQAGIAAFFECGEVSSNLCPGAGVPNARPEVVTLTGADGVTRCPFADGTLRVFIDATEQTDGLVSVDGVTGEFTLGFDPTPTEVCTVEYLGR